MAERFVQVRPGAFAQLIYNVKLGSSGSDIACVISSSEKIMDIKTFTPSTLNFSKIIQGNLSSSSTSVDRVGLFTVIITQAPRPWETSLLVSEDNEKVSFNTLPGKFTHFEGSIATGIDQDRKRIVAIFDITAQGKPKIISSYQIDGRDQGDVAPLTSQVLSLSENTGIVRNLNTHSLLFDARMSSPNILRQISIPNSSTLCRGVVAGCSVFFCTNDSQAGSSDNLLVFSALNCPGIAPGHAWKVAVNSLFRATFFIKRMFAWHPAHGSLAVVLCGARTEQILIINPRTLTYAKLHQTQDGENDFLLPGHIHGQPVILRMDRRGTAVSVLV